MTTALNTGGLPVSITVDGKIEFSVQWGHESTAVEISCETGCDGWGGCGRREVFLTIDREDWDAVVAHLALPRFEHRAARTHPEEKR